MCEETLIAVDAVGVVVPEDVPVASEVEVALVAGEVAVVPVLVHGFGVLPGKYQLRNGNNG